jgi:hypothetical protein
VVCCISVALAQSDALDYVVKRELLVSWWYQLAAHIISVYAPPVTVPTMQFEAYSRTPSYNQLTIRRAAAPPIKVAAN